MFYFKLNKQNKPSFKSLAKTTGFHISTIRKRLRKGMTIEEVISTKSRTKAKPYFVEGKNYPSIIKLASYYGLKPEIVTARLRKGWSVEETLKLKERVFDKFIVNGIGFKNFNRMCKFFKVEGNTVNKRLERGWTLEEALELEEPEFSNKCKGILYVIENSINAKVYVGITTRTLHSRFMAHKRSAKIGSNTKLHKAMRELGIDNFNVKQLVVSKDRFKLGRLEKEYIDNCNSIKNGYNTLTGGGGVGEHSGIKVEHKGKAYRSIAALAKNLGMHKDTLARRFKKNLPLEGSVRGKKVKYEGIVYDNVVRLSEHLGISEQIVRIRLSKNIPLDKPVQVNKKHKIIEHKGKRYNSIKELALELDMVYSTVVSKLSKGTL